MLTLALGALMLAVNISLFCFVQYNILRLHMYKSEPAVRLAHYVAEVAAILNCVMCFFDCYVVCFERAHSRRHVKALVYAMLSAVIFVSNWGSYYYITNGHYQYTIPTKKITAFYPPHLETVWYDEIHDYLVEYEDARNVTKTRQNAGKFLKTLSHFQNLSHCCGVTGYNDYTSLGLPVPPTCECGKWSILKVVRCTRGHKLSTGVARLVADESETGHDPGERSSSSKYELTTPVFKNGCEKDRAHCVYVLTGMLRLLVSSVALQFLSLLFIPLPWLYQK
ncbi:hypothetical protein FJT64_022716 [Amphibalanus amphitrite]|uniref:Uncharacterized protein n=1 Tax=Amphibalanus amphitrite TaxID=1232801 RepID=A0A6A4WPL1_AMPAM|nr:hypothetical protein FJT64_022716 [Amphibalanus amphitrite]